MPKFSKEVMIKLRITNAQNELHEAYMMLNDPDSSAACYIGEATALLSCAKMKLNQTNEEKKNETQKMD